MSGDIVKQMIWDGQDQHDINSFHDVVFEATGESYNKEKLKGLFLSFDNDICCLSHEWGLSDTEVREKIYRILSKNK